MKLNQSWAILAVALPLALGAFGCAQERDPINRVQPHALAKSFYVGDLGTPDDDPEFYTATTVVDVPYGADQGFVFPGLVGRMNRIKWEITENNLNARLTYEMIEGVDGHGSKTVDSGKVIASYGIDKHFDIRRAYNPSTGEELNVIEENSSDRPWYEREYFRVDWSKNLVGSSRLWDPLAGDDYEVESLAYYVSDPNHPDAPHFDVEEGYFDVTNKLYLQPTTLNLGFGEVPACFYRGSLVVGATYPWGNCENSEVTVRYSFRRIAQEGEEGFRDFQPSNWDGSRFQAFGIFTTERLGWDRNYGIVDDKWIRFAQRYNIWQASHTDRECGTPESLQMGCSPTRDGDFNCDGTVDAAAGEFADGTHDECEDGENWGSRCDSLVGKCTIPLSKREVRPVAWHYTVNMEDAPIFEATEFATWQWDAAIRMAVQAGRYAECVRTGTASLIGSAYQQWYTSGVSVENARLVCGALFPVDNSYDDAELDAVREVNMCVKQGGVAEDCAEQLVSTPYLPQRTEGLSNACTYDDPNDDDEVPERCTYGSGSCTTATEATDCPDLVSTMATSVAAMRPMVLICQSPVAESDDEACGEPGTVARPGDIRYHQINVWPTRQSVSPWGYGPSLSDPLTGEIISAGINVYNAVTDYAAQKFVDQVRWINGEISNSNLTSGKHVHDWVTASNYASSQMGPKMTRETIEKRLSGMAGVSLDKIKKTAQFQEKVDMTKMADMMRQLDREVLPPGAIPEDRSVFEERIRKAKETGVEASLMNPMWLQMAAVDPDLPHETKLDMASPLRGMNSRALKLAHDKAHRMLADKGQCILSAPEPTGIPAVANMMKAKFPATEGATMAEEQERVAKMWTYLRTKMHYTVVLHEMGHTIGLRHNFVSSYDKYNYKTQYWQLRTNSGAVKTICDGPQADGADCIGPRYYDPLTQDEIDNSIWTWQQTSVMDYAGDLTQDMLGLGSYDLAAARMFYGDVLDVRADVEIDDSGIGDSVQSMVDYPGYLFGQIVNCPQGTGQCSSNSNSGNIGHYSFYNEAFKLVQPERCLAVEPKQPSWWKESDWGVWDPVWDGQIVHNERCSRPPVDYVTWEDMVPDSIVVDFDDPEYFTPRRASDVHKRPRVPYGFLTDGHADGWSPSAYRHDNGADMYEELIFHSNMYENRHIFDNFRNGRVNFTVYGAYQRALSRYHAKIENLTQGFAYSVDFILRRFAENIGLPFEEVVAANSGEGSFLYDHAVAASVGFDHFVRVLTRPHRGSHYCEGGPLGCNPAGDRQLKPLEDIIGGLPVNSAVGATIPNGNLVAGGSVSYGGRPLNNDFQYAQGAWTIDYLNQAGSYYEKTYALESMLNASYGAMNFYRFDGLDARFRHVNFSDLFPEGMRRLIGAALTEDTVLLGPRMSSDATGKPNVTADPDSGVEYPTDPLAWVSYIPDDGPIACSPVDSLLSCVDTTGAPIGNGASTDAWFVDPQIGYEVQKFIIFWFYVYQPRAEMMDWVDLARLYRIGKDNDPELLPAQTVEYIDPESGLRYVAKRFGDETLFGKTYDKGIASKMLQWANSLAEKAYELDATTPFDPVTGAANIVVDANGDPVVKGSGTNPKCDDNPACVQLRNYRGLMDFMVDTAVDLGFDPVQLQIFGD